MNIVSKTSLTPNKKLLESQIGNDLKKLFDTPNIKLILLFNKEQGRLEFKITNNEMIKRNENKS